MRKLFSYIFLVFISAVFVWIVANDPRIILQIVWFFFIIVILCSIIGVVFLMPDYLKNAWQGYLDRRRMQELLGDMTLEEVLEQSPYEYGYFQGEDYCRIWRKDTNKGFVNFHDSDYAAKMWIVEQYFQGNPYVELI